MYMISVSSKNIAEIGYDERLAILYIRFNNDRTYEYYDVPKLIFYGLKTASSVNDYFIEYIKGKYQYSEV